MNGFLVVQNNVAYMKGVDHGGEGTIITRNHNAIVVKWPAHTYWVSMGERDYQPAITCVYKILDVQDNNTIKVEQFIDWENTRAKKQY